MSTLDTTKDERATHDGRADFDFLIGTWQGHNRRLKERLKGCTEWEEFGSTLTCRKILGGAGNLDEATMNRASGTSYGQTLRLYDPASRQWRIYWASHLTGALDVPMIGGFRDGRGEFYDQELFEGRAIFVRFLWTVQSADRCRWEQAFSEDGGRTWETNWTMDWTRTEP
jgi:hypothetical protein